MQTDDYPLTTTLGPSSSTTTSTTDLVTTTTVKVVADSPEMPVTGGDVAGLAAFGSVALVVGAGLVALNRKSVR